MQSQSDIHDDDFVLFTWTGVDREWVQRRLRRVSGSDAGLLELNILDSIWHRFGQVDSTDELASRAFGCFLEKHPERAFNAIQRCFANGWIQFLNESFVAQMQQRLVDGGYELANGLIGESSFDQSSIVGLISFTKAGASLFHQWIDFNPSSNDVEHWCKKRLTDIGPLYSSDACEMTVEFHAFGTTLDECECAVGPPENSQSATLIDEDPPVEIGRWCDRWWNLFERGFRIRFRERHYL